MDRYNSDFENDDQLTARLSEYPSKIKRDSITNNANQTYLQQQQHQQFQQSQQSTELCSPLHEPAKQHVTANNLHTPTGLLATGTTTTATATTANNKYLTNANLGFLSTNTTTASAVISGATNMPTRSTNPFLNGKYDSQSNSDSVSDRVSFSGSSIMLDHLSNNANDYAGTTNQLTNSVLNSAFMLPPSSTANSLNPISAAARDMPNINTNSIRSHRNKNGRGLNRASGMTSSSSGASSNSNATLNSATNRNSERDKLKMQQQMQMELREYEKETNIESSNNSISGAVGGGAFAIGSGGAAATDAYGEHLLDGEIDELPMSIEDDSTEPPPEPAPPEIPPRTQSLLMSLRKHSEYKLKYEEKGDQKHEEFIPTGQAMQQQQKGKSTSRSFQRSFWHTK